MIAIAFISLLSVGALALYLRRGQQPDAAVSDVQSDAEVPSDVPKNIGINPENSFDAKVILFSRAIASAEGFGIAGKIPTIYHNPGDLKPPDGTAGYFTGQSGVGKGGHAVFLTDDAGWYALYRQVKLMATNKSRHYNTAMSIEDVAGKYAEDSKNWANNVATFLGVSISTTLEELFYGKI